MTREEWLQLFIEKARPHFKRVGCELPERIRASIGFTSKGVRSPAIGECWRDSVTKDKTFEIFIAPTEEDPARIADILTHELVHSGMTDDEGHGKEFRRVAESLGLCGKMTATVAGPAWFEWANPILEEIGPYPGDSVNVQLFIEKRRRGHKVPRQAKCVCSECGFLFRTSLCWLESCTQIRCPNPNCEGEVKVEIND